jgi:Protein of unknown function (DUF4236)
MGFYLRRSLRLGPFRFNLSKSGIGVSAGVKGLRVGVDARGKGYVAGGRYGLYFRERLSPPPQDRTDGVAQPADGAASTGPLTPATILVLMVLIGVAVAGVIYTTAPPERAPASTRSDELLHDPRGGEPPRAAPAVSVPAPSPPSSTPEAKVPTRTDEVSPDKPGCTTTWYGRNSVTICDSPSP